MNKICLLYPYFGTFNKYFPLFLASASLNRHIDFHFYTDASNCSKYSGKYDNIFFHEDNLESIKKRLSKALSIDCVLTNPYKLCDYKPFYNLIFQESKLYEFWGFGDVDLILGNLSLFDSTTLNRYCVIGKLGHLCLIKNDSHLTEVFLKNNNKTIAEVCRDENNRGFDERDHSWFKTIEKLKQDSVLDIDNIISDIRPQYKKLSRHKFTNKPERLPLNGRRYFSFNNGILLAHSKKEEPIEILYIHFQKRPMLVRTKNTFQFIMIPNLFISYESDYSYFKATCFRPFEFIRHQIYWLKVYFKK